MRITKTLMTGVVAAVAVAGTASATVTPVIVDNFTTATNTIPTASGSFSEPLSGSGILGTRSIGFDYWTSMLDGNNSTRSVILSGNGSYNTQLAAGTNGDDNIVYTKYNFAPQNMIGKAFYVAGSGTGSGGNSTYTPPMDGDPGYWSGNYWYGIGIALTDSAGARVTYQINMCGNQVLGNFSFLASDIAAAAIDGIVPANTSSTEIGAGFSGDPANGDTFDFASVTGVEVYQYARNQTWATAPTGTWNYTATSFSIVPAPGALALLGAAGLIGGTRRRR